MCTDTITLPRHLQRELLAQARLGNPDAFAGLVRPYRQALYHKALRLTGSPADAEDVQQEALLRAFSKLEQFAGGADPDADEFRAWVARIAANASIDILRRRKITPILSYDEMWGENEMPWISRVAAATADPEDQYARKQMRDRMAAAIERLPADLRTVCLLRDVLELPTQKVAHRLGISGVAVRLRLFRAHAKLRDAMRSARAKTCRKERPARAGSPRAAFRAILDPCCGD